MTKQRYLRTQQIEVETCERCEQSHVFPIEITFDEEIEAMGMISYKSQKHEVVVTCPIKNEAVIIEVPVSLTTMQKLVHIQVRE